MAKRTTYLEGWKLYPVSAFGHHVQGTLVSLGIVLAPINIVIIALFWTVLYISYQGLSVLRKEDSPGLDIADFMVGAGIGIFGSLIWRYMLNV